MWVQGEAENHGTTFSNNTSVIGGHLEGNCMNVYISESKNLRNWDGVSPLQPELTLIPKLVVNSAGLSAPALVKRFIGLDNVFIPPAYYARGCYFSLANTKVAPFKHLIYPIPEDGGLGVHVTLDLDGQIKFGPDVEWIDGIDDTLSFLNRYSYFLVSYSFSPSFIACSVIKFSCNVIWERIGCRYLLVWTLNKQQFFEVLNGLFAHFFISLMYGSYV